MRNSLSVLLAAASLPWLPIPVEAQSVGHVFKGVKASVVVIRTKEKDVAVQGQGMVKVTGVGSGVLISADGKVMTAAHLVHTADEITLSQPAGLLVQRVAEGSPSAAIGLRAGTMKATINGQTITVGGDVILSVQGIPIDEPTAYEKIQERLSRLHPGAPIAITVLRDGRQVELIGRLP